MIHALVVGIDHYRTAAIRDLVYAVADARALANLLSNGMSPDQLSVRRLVDGEATKQAIVEAIKQMSNELEDGDIVLLYFAGHGCTDLVPNTKSTRIYLAPVDADPANVEATTIEVHRELPRLVSNLREFSDLFLVVLDCCFAGASAERSFLGDHLRARLELDATWGDFLNIGAPPSITGIELGSGCAVWAAADKDSPAFELDEHGHGCFTYALIEAYEQRGRNGPLGLLSLVEAVHERTMELSAGRQQTVFSCWKCQGAKLPGLER